MSLIRTLFALCIIFSLASCSYQKRKILFKTASEIETDKDHPIQIENPQEYPQFHIASEGDVIMVRLLNDDGERSSFDQLLSSREDAQFVVHDKNVTLPSVGEIEVEGLNKYEIIEKVKQAYAKELIDPIIDVDFVSLTVNVLGEVVKSGRYPINGQTNLVEAIGMAGGFTPYGILKNVKIIRGEGEKQEIIVVDVSNINTLSHAKLTLRDKDIIYVEPRRVKQFDTAIRPYLFLTSIISSAAAIFIVITRTN